MKHRTTLLIIIISVLFCFVGTAVAQTYSGSGRKPPRKLSDRQLQVISEMLPFIPKEVNPLEIIAIALVESRLTPKAVSHTGDYGLMQVNCRIHRKRLKKVFGLENCEKDMMSIENSVNAGVHILLLMRNKYKRCRGQKVYACYNGGPGWMRVKARCLEQCKLAENPEARCKKCGRPARYSNSVKRNLRFLKREHSKKRLPF